MTLDAMPTTTGPAPFGYEPSPDERDEMIAADGSLRPYWRAFAEAFAAVPAAEMARRRERGLGLIAETGIGLTQADTGFSGIGSHEVGLESDRPLSLDPAPLLLDSAEWAELSAGLEQRARLLDAILQDVYGPRRLLGEELPAALILGHPHFLRACVGFRPPGDHFLHVGAADLARTEDGSWAVLSDRTEAPAGAGYAVENRLIVTRMLPEFFRSARVRWLTPYFESLQETLVSLSARRFETPRVVLLTSGPDAPTWFEHAYLARLLGCTLVEAEDLTVRDDHVFLKTLDGLQPVHVIFRRMPALYCDPLEFDSRSRIGLPGLTRAVRSGTVAMANALGSGVLETPALAAFLPGLCRSLLGETLKLASVGTWWCGEEEGLKATLAGLDRLVIKSTFNFRAPAIFPDQLSAAERQELVARIKAQPHLYTAQEPVHPTTAPVWSEGRLVPRPVVFRTFLAVQKDGYMTMPGALVRASAERALPTAALQGIINGGSKDAWVLSDEDAPTHASGMAAAAAPVRLVRGGRDLPSRVADNMFWFGRYLERCEDMTRVLRAVYTQAEESINAGRDGEVGAFLGFLGQLGLSVPARGKPATVAAAAALLSRQQFDPAYPTGLAANLDRLTEAAARVRDRLSIDTWRNVQRLYRRGRGWMSRSTARDGTDIQAGLDGLILSLEASCGLVLENMTRGLGWRFLEIGRRMERATHGLDLLAGLVDAPTPDLPAALDLLLTVSDSSMTYRQRYFLSLQVAPVLDLLLCDPTNPRSVAFQFAELAQHLDHLVAFHEAARMRPEQRLMIFLESALKTADIDVLAESESDGRYYHLGKLLGVLSGRLWELSETLTREYFAHAGRSPSRNAPRGREMVL